MRHFMAILMLLLSAVCAQAQIRWTSPWTPVDPLTVGSPIWLQVGDGAFLTEYAPKVDDDWWGPGPLAAGHDRIWIYDYKQNAVLGVTTSGEVVRWIRLRTCGGPVEGLAVTGDLLLLMTQFGVAVEGKCGFVVVCEIDLSDPSPAVHKYDDPEFNCARDGKTRGAYGGACLLVNDGDSVYLYHRVSGRSLLVAERGRLVPPGHAQAIEGLQLSSGITIGRALEDGQAVGKRYFEGDLVRLSPSGSIATPLFRGGWNLLGVGSGGGAIIAEGDFVHEVSLEDGRRLHSTPFPQGNYGNGHLASNFTLAPDGSIWWLGLMDGRPLLIRFGGE